MANTIEKLFKDIIAKLIELDLPIESINILSHNGGKFDIKVILNALAYLVSENKAEIREIVSDSSNNIYSLKVIYQTITFVFTDSYKLIPSSVDSISKNFLVDENISKIEVNHVLLQKELSKQNNLNNLN